VNPPGASEYTCSDMLATVGVPVPPTVAGGGSGTRWASFSLVSWKSGARRAHVQPQ